MKKKTILIIGSGGREHAIGWKLKQSSEVDKIYFAPGNGGTATIGENIRIKSEDIPQLLHFAQEKEIDLTIVGPEAPLALGIVNGFNKVNLPIFGPIKEAAQLESSKAWAIEFMKENSIPYPISEVFTDFSQAFRYVKKLEGNCVIKADGLALGKGVFVSSTVEEAEEALRKILIDKAFGSAGEKVIVQEKLHGKEVSVMAFCDGKVAIPIISVQDHKRVFDNDKGPNTGGMGAFAPALISVTQLKKMQRLLTLVVEQMSEKGMPYVGVLYGGFMIVENEPYVLEFNCRMGDPETQVQLPLLGSDFLTIMEACIEGKLTPELVTFNDQSAVCVVLASEGYPGSYAKGKEIRGLERVDKKSGLSVFHAGTKLNNGQLLTDGGRVLGVTAVADTVTQAAEKVYSVIGEPIYFEGMHYRKDIGKR